MLDMDCLENRDQVKSDDEVESRFLYPLTACSIACPRIDVGTLVTMSTHMANDPIKGPGID